MQWILRLALTVSMFAGYARSARAADPQADPVIDIAVDVAGLGVARAELASTLVTELNRLLAAYEQLPAGVIVRNDRRLFVEIRPSPIPGTDDVLIHVEVQLDGKILGESLTETCLACTNEQVAEKALVLFEPLLAGLPAPAPVVAPAPIAAHVDEERDAAPTKPRPGDALLISSSVLLGVGVASIGVGVGLIVANERVVSPPEALDFEVIKYREVGIATTVIGGAAALTGAVLLGLVLKRRGRSNVVAAPVLEPSNWGISFVGRF
jgi:hypothetical protein